MGCDMEVFRPSSIDSVRRLHHILEGHGIHCLPASCHYYPPTCISGRIACRSHQDKPTRLLYAVTCTQFNRIADNLATAFSDVMLTSALCTILRLDAQSPYCAPRLLIPKAHCFSPIRKAVFQAAPIFDIAMLWRVPNVTMTGALTRCSVRDVRTCVVAGARYNSTSATPLAPNKLISRVNITSRQKDCWIPQLTYKATREYTTIINNDNNNNMPTNNAELQLGNVFNVKDKVALVSGGGSGIGLMISQTLAVNGAKVYIVGRTKEKLETAVEAHGKGISGQLIPVVGDVSTKDGVDKLVKEIESREKCLHVLVNNAGIAPGKGESSVDSAEKLKSEFYDGTTEKEWLDVYQTNVVAPFLMSLAFLPLLNKSTEATKGYSGTVVNISSVSGHIRISQGHFAYNSSKGAMIHLNKMLASEIAKCGVKVRVNSIAPGVFPSEMTTNDSRDDNQKSEMPKEQKEGLPAQRPGNDRDMAAAILFVVGCQYLNGQTVTVDGGYAIQVGN